MPDDEIARLLEQYPAWAPTFGELAARVDDRIVVTGFTLGEDRKLSVRDVATFVALRKA